MPSSDKTLSKIMSRIPQKPKTKSASPALEDLAMIAEELVSALDGGNSNGVAEALRAAFGCVSEMKTKKYAKGGIAEEDEEDEEWDGNPDTLYADDVDEDELADFKADNADAASNQPVSNAMPSPDDLDEAEAEQQRKSYGVDYDLADVDPDRDANVTSSKIDYVDDNLLYVDRRENWQDRMFSDADYAENEAAYKRNVDAISDFSKASGAYIGSRIDQDMLDTLMGDPELYVKVRSNPKAYDWFRREFQNAFDVEPGESVNLQPMFDTLGDPKFWERMGESYLSPQQYAAMLKSMGMSIPASLQKLLDSDAASQQQLQEDQQRTAETQQPKRELVEMVDPDTGTTHLVDNPQKVLRKAPKAKLVRRTPKPKNTPLPSRTITVGPMR